MLRLKVLVFIAVFALCGGALAYWSLDKAQTSEPVGAALPDYEEGEACETCSLRHQRLQRERNWTTE